MNSPKLGVARSSKMSVSLAGAAQLRGAGAVAAFHASSCDRVALKVSASTESVKTFVAGECDKGGRGDDG